MRKMLAIGWVCLLAAGCQLGNRELVRDMAVLHAGDKLQSFQFVSVEPDGTVVMRDLDKGEAAPLTRVQVGQTFGEQVEAGRGEVTEYCFRVLGSDAQKQQATIEGTTEMKRGGVPRQ
jgi:hypothetical protein